MGLEYHWGSALPVLKSVSTWMGDHPVGRKNYPKLFLTKIFIETIFLAVMSSSRSDVVTQFVRSFVFSCVCSFFSFSVFEVSSCPKEFQWCLKAGLGLFEV